ncbi:MAG: Helix-turn-helix domain [Actinomycetota bacterium]|nr:Helix-turn-helix domain [Actinomycetota bacterium]
MEAARSRLTCTVSEMAGMLGISRSKAYSFVRTGEVKAIRIGRRVVVPRRVIYELLGSSNQLGSGAVAQPAGQRGKSGVEAADLLEGGIRQTDPGGDVEDADRRALDSGVLGGCARAVAGDQSATLRSDQRSSRFPKLASVPTCSPSPTSVTRQARAC